MAVNRIRVIGNELDSAVSAHSVGETLSVHAFRRDELMEFKVELQQAPTDTCVLQLMDNADESVRARRDAWLAGISGERVRKVGSGSSSD